MGNGRALAAWLHPGTVHTRFMQSLLDLISYDQNGPQQLAGQMQLVPGAGTIDKDRNRLTRKFLDHPSRAEWLWMVDSDMTFGPDILHRLIASADPHERPIVGGLAFMWQKIGLHGHDTPEYEPRPTIADYDPTKPVVVWRSDYQPDSLVSCDVTGAACMLIHRSALETIRGRLGTDDWWTRLKVADETFGEDVSFCLQARQAGLPVFVNTAAKTGHMKTIEVDEHLFHHRPLPPTLVAIPVKNNLHLTRPLVEQLTANGGQDRLLLLDNGSDDGTAEWAAGVPGLGYANCDGFNIHQMWNLAVDEARKLSIRTNLILLNNDLEVPAGFAWKMATALRHTEHVALCPNYDGRPRGDGPIQDLQGVCAGRYDGTGGLAGFAMAIKNELFVNGYRFPEECHWWYGDTDMVFTIAAQGRKVGMAVDVPVVHVGGGGQTGDWNDPHMRELLAQDRAWFEAKWAPVEAAS